MKNEILNCPNCGAVRTGPKCEYCGTLFEIEDERADNYDETVFYADGVPFHVSRTFSRPAKETAEAFNHFAEVAR